MEDNEQIPKVKEICTIRIGFPVTSDAQAIEYKKKIADILSDIAQVRIEFSIMTAPTLPMLGK